VPHNLITDITLRAEVPLGVDDTNPHRSPSPQAAHSPMLKAFGT